MVVQVLGRKIMEVLDGKCHGSFAIDHGSTEPKGQEEFIEDVTSNANEKGFKGK